MPYTLLPAEEAEKNLFFRLDGETAERRGAIGYMRAGFGRSGKEFWTTWFDSQAHLKTPAFKNEFDGLVNSLRGDGERPPFASRYALAVFCADRPGTELPAGRGKGFMIRTPDYSYYARCNPQYGDYDIGLYAYDNRYLLPELAGLHDTPHGCYSILPSTGEIVLIRRGETGCPPIAYQSESREMNRVFVNDRNAEIGVTRAQEAAMLAGLLRGWDAPAAKPWNYEPDGSLRPLQKKREEHER
jgi:hypothetical protein